MNEHVSDCVCRFKMRLSGLEVLVNDDGTRTFLAVSVVSPKKQVRFFRPRICVREAVTLNPY
jgi:hypothetical protein